MVCIAAFIILCIMSLFVGIIAIIRRDIGRKYFKTFKKAWACVWKKVRFQKCETNFKTDIKNSILSRVIIKKPKLVKPLSVTIEIISVIIVIIAIWSLAVLIKGGLALIAFGNCDVQNPENCFTGSQVCSEGRPGPRNPIEAAGRWFTDFGIIGEGIWSRFKHWDAKDFIPAYISDNNQYFNPYDPDKPTALDIFDPGCSNCLQSFVNKRDAGFFDTHNVAIMPYVLGDGTGLNKFANSSLVAKYIVATYHQPLKNTDRPAAWRIVENIFTTYTADNQIYQAAFTSGTATEQFVESTLRSWLKSFGYTDAEVSLISALAHSDKISRAIDDFRQIAIDRIHIDVPVVGVPTMISDGNRKSGIFRQ